MHDLPAAERLDQLRTAIAGRLRRVCAHLPAEEFDALVLKIATVTLRYEQRPPLSSPPVTNAPPDGVA
jgi:hypothetical protein